MTLQAEVVGHAACDSARRDALAVYSPSAQVPAVPLGGEAVLPRALRAAHVLIVSLREVLKLTGIYAASALAVVADSHARLPRALRRALSCGAARPSSQSASNVPGPRRRPHEAADEGQRPLWRRRLLAPPRGFRRSAGGGVLLSHQHGVQVSHLRALGGPLDVAPAPPAGREDGHESGRAAQRHQHGAEKHHNTPGLQRVAGLGVLVRI